MAVERACAKAEEYQELVDDHEDGMSAGVNIGDAKHGMKGGDEEKEGVWSRKRTEMAGGKNRIRVQEYSAMSYEDMM